MTAGQLAVEQECQERGIPDDGLRLVGRCKDGAGRSTSGTRESRCASGYRRDEAGHGNHGQYSDAVHREKLSVGSESFDTTGR